MIRSTFFWSTTNLLRCVVVFFFLLLFRIAFSGDALCGVVVLILGEMQDIRLSFLHQKRESRLFQLGMPDISSQMG